RQQERAEERGEGCLIGECLPARFSPQGELLRQAISQPDFGPTQIRCRKCLAFRERRKQSLERDVEQQLAPLRCYPDRFRLRIAAAETGKQPVEERLVAEQLLQRHRPLDRRFPAQGLSHSSTPPRIQGNIASYSHLQLGPR